jgi:hypothetical protein
MSVLAKMSAGIAEQKISQPEKISISDAVDATSTSQQREPTPCPTCGSPSFWLCVYGGGLRCLSCEPPPGRSLIRGRLLIISLPADPRNPGGPWRYQLNPWELHALGERAVEFFDETVSPREYLGRIVWKFDRLGYCVSMKIER